MQYSAPAFAPVAFQLVPQVILGKFDVLGGRAGIKVAQRFLHHMQGVAFLHHFGATCVAHLVPRGARLAVGVEQRGLTTTLACEHNRSIPAQT